MFATQIDPPAVSPVKHRDYPRVLDEIERNRMRNKSMFSDAETIAAT
jgi:hypothetical protein